jgi:hypothetical protein
MGNENMKLFGLKWMTCADCPKRFLVLEESQRVRSLARDAKRKATNGKVRESKRWSRDKRDNKKHHGAVQRQKEILRVERVFTIAMLLTVQQAYELLAKHGMFAREICDKCGRVLGAARFTRRSDAGVWCSRECRDGADANATGTCQHCLAKIAPGKRRGSRFCDDACKQAAHRSNPTRQVSETAGLSVTNTSIYAGFSLKKSGAGVSPLSRPSLPLETPPSEKRGARV